MPPSIAADIKTLTRLGKKYGVNISKLNAENVVPPQDVLKELAEELELIKPVVIEHICPIDGKARVVININMTWGIADNDVSFDLLSIKTVEVPKLFSKIIINTITDDAYWFGSSWQEMLKELSKRADVKQFKARAKKTFKKIRKYEKDYPGFDIHEWFGEL